MTKVNAIVQRQHGVQNAQKNKTQSQDHFCMQARKNNDPTRVQWKKLLLSPFHCDSVKALCLGELHCGLHFLQGLRRTQQRGVRILVGRLGQEVHCFLQVLRCVVVNSWRNNQNFFRPRGGKRESNNPLLSMFFFIIAAIVIFPAWTDSLPKHFPRMTARPRA